MYYLTLGLSTTTITLFLWLGLRTRTIAFGYKKGVKDGYEEGYAKAYTVAQAQWTDQVQLMAEKALLDLKKEFNLSIQVLRDEPYYYVNLSSDNHLTKGKTQLIRLKALSIKITVHPIEEYIWKDSQHGVRSMYDVSQAKR